MIYLYFILAVIAFCLINKDSTNPVWVDIILGLCWPLIIVLLILGFVFILGYNVVYELKKLKNKIKVKR